jgi:hypothetical protein
MNIIMKKPHLEKSNSRHEKAIFLLTRSIFSSMGMFTGFPEQIMYG